RGRTHRRHYPPDQDGGRQEGAAALPLPVRMLPVHLSAATRCARPVRLAKSGILFEARAFRLSSRTARYASRSEPGIGPSRVRASWILATETLCAANAIALRFGERGSGAIHTKARRP